MATWDTIVIGLGGVGSAATYHLAAAGQRVLGIDQYPPVHDHGSSHGHTRIIRQAYFEHPSYVPLLKRAYELWDLLERDANEQVFFRTGLVEMGPADGIVIPGVLRSAAEHQLDIETMSSSDVTSRWAGIGGEPNWTAVIERNAGFLLVENCVRVHLRLAHQAGASLVHGTAVAGWEIDGTGIAVTTDQGVERAGNLVLAAGPWSAQLLGNLGSPLRVVRKHQYWFEPQRAGFELAEGFPCFFHETADGFFYGFPSIDGCGVKVARHSGGEVIDAPTPAHKPDAEDQALVGRYVDQCLPGLGKRLLRQAGCYYTVTPDEHFVIDTHPTHPQVAILAGLSGHGFKFTSVLGEIASQLATDGRTSFDISLFSIDRLA